MEQLDRVISALFFGPIILPFVIGLIIILSFRKDQAARLIGIFVLKPVIAYPAWVLLNANVTTPGNSILYNVFLILPGLVLTVVIVYFFRSLFLQYPIVRFFLIGDMIRWGNTWLIFHNEASVGPMLSNPLVWFGLIFPSVYSVIALITLIARISVASKKEQMKSI